MYCSICKFCINITLSSKKLQYQKMSDRYVQKKIRERLSGACLLVMSALIGNLIGICLLMVCSTVHIHNIIYIFISHYGAVI